MKTSRRAAPAGRLRRGGGWLLVTAAAAIGAAPAAAQAPAALAEALRARLAGVSAGAVVRLGKEPVTIPATLLEAYARGRFQPLWLDPTAVVELNRALGELPDDGLDPALYHADALLRLSEGGDAASAADLDLLRTEILLEVEHDLLRGRARPSLPGIGAEFERGPTPLDANGLSAVIRSARIREELDRVRPRHFVYAGLRASLARLRRIAALGGWQALAPGPALRRDSADARIPALRRRLSTEGYASADSGSAAVFDEPLERAVVSFQHHHGLNEDGIVGQRTRAALDVPVEARIDQVRINLERARWLGTELPERFVVVNTAGAKAYLVDGARVAFETRAIVGKLYTKTPIFSALLRTIELDPTWTVPPGIVDEVLGEIRKDPGYLAREHMTVLDARDRPVDPAGIDFAHARAASFPYTLRQEPGPTNPLGRIKLLFPNSNNVYLHDTPSRSLFEREERTFSHGCIRVADPFGLAEMVLDQPSSWSRASLEGATGTDSTKVIRVPKPVSVLVFYWTASTDERGELHFYRDAYGRDTEVLRALGPTPRPSGR